MKNLNHIKHDLQSKLNNIKINNSPIENIVSMHIASQGYTYATFFADFAIYSLRIEINIVDTLESNLDTKLFKIKNHE